MASSEAKELRPEARIEADQLEGLLDPEIGAGSTLNKAINRSIKKNPQMNCKDILNYN